MPSCPGRGPSGTGLAPPARNARQLTFRRLGGRAAVGLGHDANRLDRHLVRLSRPAALFARWSGLTRPGARE